MPVLALRDPSGSANDSLMVMKLWLIVDGIFIWEFVANLHYGWSVIRGRQPYRWAVWIYFLARWSTLAVVVLDLVSFNITSPINCQAWAHILWVFGVLGLGSGSLLVMLRIFAIWNMNKLIVAISVGVWGTNVTLMSIAAIQIRTEWEPLKKACVVTNIQICKASLIALFFADIILLLIMLIGLLRLRRHGGGSLELGRLLWKQGCIWFALATAAELPQVVLVVVNSSDVIKMMFVIPAMITMTIGATRMYRSLTNFASPPNLNTAHDSVNAQRSNRLPRVPNITKDSSFIQIHPNRLEVTVHTDYEEHQMSHATHCGSSPSSDGHLADKAQELSLGDDVEDREAGK